MMSNKQQLIVILNIFQYKRMLIADNYFYKKVIVHIIERLSNFNFYNFFFYFFQMFIWFK